MKYLVVLAALSFPIHANTPVESCITYTLNEVKLRSANLILEKIFDKHLHADLEKKFPDLNLDWTQWSTEANSFANELGVKRTSMKACFDVTSIYKNSELVSGIMQVANDRFTAGLKYYSTKSSKHIEKEKIDNMLTGFDTLIKSPEVQNAIDSKLKETSIEQK